MSYREALLERTFRIYLGHLLFWLALLVPAVVTGAAVYVLVVRAVASLWWGEAPPVVWRALAGMPWLAASAWFLAAAVGAQVLALSALSRSPDRRPPIVDLIRELALRFHGTFATSMLVIVHLVTIGLLGVAAATGLAWLPLGVLPHLGVSQMTARSLSLLVLLPLLVAGAVPALWWLGRHAIAIPLQALEGEAAWASLRRARALTRGHALSVLGLLLVTSLASQAVVLLTRAAGSLLTLLVAPDRFRPIFGEGPLRSAAGAEVQIGATLLATFVTLPLVLLPLSMVYLALRNQERERARGPDA